MATAANHSAGDASSALRIPAPSPWSQQTDTSSDFQDDSAVIRAESGADGGKKPAWNKPNGTAEVGPVMGAELWPALSESTRASPKAFSSDSPKLPPDGSVTLPQGAGIIHPSISHNQVMTNNTHSSLAPPNNVVPMRQKSMKRGGGGSSSGNNNIANGGFSQPPPSPHTSASYVPPNMIEKSEPAATEMSPRDRTYKETGQRGVGSQSRSGSDHFHRSDSFKKNNNAPQHNNFGGRGNQDRGNHEWNSQRSFNGRDSHLQQQRVSPRGFRPQTHASASFVHPQPVTIRPYPMVYPDMPPQMFYYAPPPETLRGVPLVAPMPPPAMYYAVSDPLIPKIVYQVDYYFSDENLVKDTYLRSNMDDQGWVPVQLIASFKKMSQLTENIQLILDAIRASSAVEVQGDKIRRRNDWYRWVLPAVQSPKVSSPQAQGSYNHKMLIANVHNLSLGENASYRGQQTGSSSRSYSGDFSQSQAPGPAAVGGGPERIVSARSPSA